MKKKLFLASIALMFGISLSAQEELNDGNKQYQLDAEENTEEITTLKDIITLQQNLQSQSNMADHFRSVFGRRTYTNFAYNSTTSTITQAPESDKNPSFSEFKSDWGASFNVGTNYSLHKKPIAKMVSINLDYSWIDLSVNHYKKESGTYSGYNSKEMQYTKDGDNYYYRPWGEEKYEASYGMAIGPSVTVAPFVPLGNKGLDFIKLNVYFHVGYNASLLYTNIKDLNESKDQYAKDVDEKSLEFGHGLFTKFGFNISWKAIGIGYEMRTGKNEYRSLVSSVFGSDKFKMEHKMSRVYLQLRM